MGDTCRPSSSVKVPSKGRGTTAEACLEHGVIWENFFRAGLTAETAFPLGRRTSSCVQPDEADEMKVPLIAPRLGSVMVILAMSVDFAGPLLHIVKGFGSYTFRRLIPEADFTL